MSMEPFDYLTYKKNKSLNNPPKEVNKKERINVTLICIITFIAIFSLVLFFIASKSSKMDIEYGRLGKEGSSLYTSGDDEIEALKNDDSEEAEEEPVKKEKFTIDKRLFLIRQEEKGPSESKVIQADKESSEVISKEQFEKIKNSGNNEEETKPAPNKPEAPLAPKPVIKPKIAPVAKPISSIEPQAPLSKVLVGRYTTMDEAREVQNNISAVVTGSIPYVKKVGAYYSVQIGAYDNFETAKSIAGRLQTKGFPSWILQ